MPGVLFAEVTVSNSFIVIAYLSIIAMAVVVIVALFDLGSATKFQPLPHTRMTQKSSFTCCKHWWTPRRTRLPSSPF